MIGLTLSGTAIVDGTWQRAGVATVILVAVVTVVVAVVMMVLAGRQLPQDYKPFKRRCQQQYQDDRCRAVGQCDGWMVGWLDGWMVGWLDGWMIGWMDGWMVEWLCQSMDRHAKFRRVCPSSHPVLLSVRQSVSLDVCVCVCVCLCAFLGAKQC